MDQNKNNNKENDGGKFDVKNKDKKNNQAKKKGGTVGGETSSDLACEIDQADKLKGKVNELVGNDNGGKEKGVVGEGEVEAVGWTCQLLMQ